MRTKINRQGFTIVELLIVIVVIGILAAITVVAYNGIQNRAHDTAVQSDMNAMAKKINLYAAEFGEYPKGGSASGSSGYAPASSMIFNVSKTAYDTTVHNLSYCIGVINAEEIWAISARSKSGNVLLFQSNKGVVNRGKVGHGSTSACGGMDAGYTYSYGYSMTSQTWFSWVNG